jgi:hypothetical protein
MTRGEGTGDKLRRTLLSFTGDIERRSFLGTRHVVLRS